MILRLHKNYKNKQIVETIELLSIYHLAAILAELEVHRTEIVFPERTVFEVFVNYFDKEYKEEKC